MGVEKTKLLARDTVFLVEHQQRHKTFIKKIKMPNTYHQKSQVCDPLMPHEVPSRPWSVLGIDLFDFEHSQWLMTADYYGKYPFIRKLPNPAPSSCVIDLLKQLFS